jgi:cytochrome P450
MINITGQKFAMLAEKTVISTILRRYVVTSSQEPLIVVPNTVLVPKRGIRLALQPRS